MLACMNPADTIALRRPITLSFGPSEFNRVNNKRQNLEVCDCNGIIFVKNLQCK